MTKEQPNLRFLPPRSEMVRALQAQDASYDGVFWIAVRTTGIFCRPGCRPPRAPKPENVEFFGSVQECVFAGYRPCKLCRPDAAQGGIPPEISRLLADVEAQPEARFTASELRSRGLTPERVRRWFHEHHGMTFAAWCRARRLSRAFTEIREQGDLDEATLGSGFSSHSGFRQAFEQTFGHPPGAAVEIDKDPLRVTFLDTPVGRMLAAANENGVALLEFNDRRMLPANYETMRQRFGVSVVPGTHRHLDQLGDELAEYFKGQRRSFEVPLAPHGTAFQEKVWAELGRIPFGETIPYDTLARRIEQPTALRAVARANGQNRISILIPCHRVIGKDGTLTGYGGGLWRKRLLLELERSGRLPGDLTPG